MPIDILALEPSAISRSLSGRSVLLAGLPKVGKSEFLATSPDTLILDFENGYGAHPGVLKVTISKWTEVKLIIKQLEKPEAQARYKNVGIDTLSEAWDLCTKYICSQNGVQDIKEIPYGAGYKMRDNEFQSTLLRIVTLNYGLLATCHLKEKVVGADEDGNDISSFAPDLDKRCIPIINGLVDVIGVIEQEWDTSGNLNRYLRTRATPTIMAGARWRYLAPRIPFGYAELEKAIGEAIDAEAQHGAKVVDHIETVQTEVLNFADVRGEALRCWQIILNTDEATAEERAATMLKKIEMRMGRKMKLSEFTEDQVDILDLVVKEIKEYAQIIGVNL